MSFERQDKKTESPPKKKNKNSETKSDTTKKSMQY